MEEVYSMLLEVAEQHMTKFILDAAKRDEQGDMYYDDFLGNGDFTKSNLPLVSFPSLYHLHFL